MTGKGTTYEERPMGRVQCRDFRDKMEAGYLAGHKMIQHGRAAEETRSWKISSTRKDPWTYCMAFPAKGGPRICPVEVCPGRAATKTAMWVHFLHQNVLDTMVILEE